MAKISYKPEVKATAAQKAPGVKIDVASAGAVGAAGAKIGKAVQSVVAEGLDLKMDGLEKENLADMAEMRNQMSKADALTREEIKRIPVQDGVDYAQQADAIKRKHWSAVSDWMETPGNIRNAGKFKGLTGQFSQIYKEGMANTSTEVEVYGQTYEFQRSRDRFNREIETGIAAGSEASIRNGVRGLVMIGAKASGDADTLYESNVEKMRVKLDDDDLSMASVALHAGDLKAYDAKIDGLRSKGYTQAKKLDMKKKGKAQLSYNTGALTLAQIESGEGAKNFLDDLNSGKAAKHASASQKTALQVSATGKHRQIKKHQYSNASKIVRDAAKGVFDVDTFDLKAADDTINGLPQDMVDDLRVQATAAAKAHADSEYLDLAAKKDETYKGIASKLLEAQFRPEDKDLRKSLAKDIKKSKLDPRLKAGLYGDYLDVLTSDLQETDDTARVGFASLRRNRPVGQVEKNTLSNVFDAFKGSLDELGPRDTLYSELQQVDRAIADAFEDGELTAAQAKEVEATALRPLYDKVRRSRLRK